MKMVKKDLKSMMRVKLRNGEMYVVVKNDKHKIITRRESWGYLDDYNEDLTVDRLYCDNRYDIVEVYCEPTGIFDLISFELGDLMWKRGEEKTITINGKPYSESTISHAMKEYVKRATQYDRIRVKAYSDVKINNLI